MELFLNYLENYSGALTLLAVVILALLVFISHRSLLKNLNKKASRPYVVLYLTKLKHDESVNYLVLENCGDKAAENIMVTLFPELQIEFPKDNPFPLFIDNPISFLAPSQRIMSALPVGDHTDRRYDCVLKYSDEKGERYTTKQTLDFSYTKYLLFSTSPENKIAKNLEKISQTLDEISAKLK